MAAGVFVTGTDTGVGKTLVSAALLRFFVSRGERAVGMKPIAAGLENGRCEDVEALLEAGNVQAPAGLVNVYAFAEPIAPHVAAERAGVHIEIDRIRSAHAKLSSLASRVVVEGAGGFLVPLGPRQSFADLAVALGLPVLLVVGVRLGCLNHALLTWEAIRARGLECRGWIANDLAADMPAREENLRTLDERLPFPRLAHIPHLPGIDAARASGFLDAAAVLKALG